jgi:hypothetical protein
VISGDYRELEIKEHDYLTALRLGDTLGGAVPFMYKWAYRITAGPDARVHL